MRVNAFASLALVVLVALASASARAEPSHGIAAFDRLKYPPDFPHFEYVNPNAPKGGTLSLVGSRAAFNASFLTFDTLNGFILKGNAPQGLRLVFDTLMTRAEDEEDSLYGLVAHSVDLSHDHATATFKLREDARFHDSTPLTSEDVAFSLETLQQHGHPLIRENLRSLSAIENPDARTLILRVEGPNPKDVVAFAAILPIFSKAFYKTRDFTETTLEPPLGSGPYRIGDFDTGRQITYERVGDYWGSDLPVNRGRWNFDAVRFEYFRDRTTQFEAFKAGAYLFREEFTSKVWATEYNFPAVEDGRVVQLILPSHLPSGAQGWFLNTRREKFSDPRVREALISAFDFEWTNRTLFYGLYARTESFFENSPMKANGLPSDAELEFLEPYREQVPDEVFGEPYSPPVSDGSGKDRRLLRKAADLLDDADWSIQDGKRRDSNGVVLSVEFLLDQPSFERVIAPYVKNLEALGIESSIRIVDSAQYQERIKSFDYDVVSRRYSLSPIPSVVVRSLWTSLSANTPGSYNLSGIADPVADALTEAVLSAQTREEQIAAARALDRVLRSGRYWVPQWHKPSYSLAFWDNFDRPAVQPRYGRGVIDTWWSKIENGEKSEQ